MIHNPPPITDLLRRYEAMRATLNGGTPLTVILAHLLQLSIGHPPWDDFLRLYHLYLQSIPAAEAQAAWGINQAESVQSTLRRGASSSSQ